MGRPRITLENANSTTKIYHLFEFDATINIVTIVTAYFIVLRSIASVNVIITDADAAGGGGGGASVVSALSVCHSLYML